MDLMALTVTQNGHGDAMKRCSLLRLVEMKRATKQRIIAENGGLEGMVGIEMTSEQKTHYAFILENMGETDLPYRVQYFDVRGFLGHSCFPNLQGAVDRIFEDNLLLVDVGALDRLRAFW